MQGVQAVRGRCSMKGEIPAYAGMTWEGAGMTAGGVGYDVGGSGMTGTGGFAGWGRSAGMGRTEPVEKELDWIPACAGMTCEGAGMT